MQPLSKLEDFFLEYNPDAHRVSAVSITGRVEDYLARDAFGAQNMVEALQENGYTVVSTPLTEVRLQSAIRNIL